MFLQTPPYFLDRDIEGELNKSKLNIKTMIFPRMLDAHGSDFAAGICEDLFKEIFYICPDCGRYMTARISSKHHDDEDFDFDSTFSCVYLDKNKEPVEGGHGRSLEKYPALSPLHKQ